MQYKNLDITFNTKITSALIKCEKCGKCCDGSNFGYILLTYEDLEKIEKHLNTKLNVVYMKHCGKNYPAISQPCQFFKDGKCSIYNIRPITCIQFPLIFSGNTIKINDSFCPAAKKIIKNE